jgi:PGF-pre-PGF domain-containing protein
MALSSMMFVALALPLVVMLFSATAPVVSAFSGSGSGTPGNPYIITTVEELQAMKDNLSGYYALGNDINASATSGWNSGAGFIPIGTDTNQFTGSFDGQGYKIINLRINRPSTNYVGLFGYVGSGGAVENVGLENENVIGENYVGGLIGNNAGTISNSYSTGSVSGSYYLGGLVGFNNLGTVSNSYSTGSVIGGYIVGGLVGRNYGAVSNSYSTGSVSGSGYIVGGLVGYNLGGTVSNSYSTGSVSGGDIVGGLVGESYGKVFNSYSTGSVSGGDIVGGLVGLNYENVSNSYSTGSVSGGDIVGGLVGESHGTVSNSFWDKETSGKTTSAGGTGKTTVQMKDIRTYTSLEWSGEGLYEPVWDFVGTQYDDKGTENIWNIRPLVNDGYPFLEISPTLPDTTPPTFSRVAATNITQNVATITWTTDELSNSAVAYGTTTSYGSTRSDATLVTSHSINLIGLSAATLYHYQVSSTDAAGNTSTSSDYTFTTSSPPSPPPTNNPPTSPEDNTPPPTPSLVLPANGANITDNTPLLDWFDVSDPSGVTYDIFIARDAGFASSALQKTGLAASTYELTPAEALAAGAYYWCVRAVDGVGNIGSWSEDWSFTVSIAPPTPPSVEIPLITPEAPATVEVENAAITALEISVLNTVENVRITVQELVDRPGEIAIVAPGAIYRYLEIIEENITDNDIGSVTITFKVEKSWIEGENIDENTITLKRYNPENGGWVSLPTAKVSEDATYVYFSATSPGLSYFAVSGTTMTPAPAAFTVSALTISPSQVSVGEEVSISVTVTNTGDLEGAYEITLKIDGVVENAENVTLAGGEDRQVMFTISEDIEGTYNVEVGGQTGAFTVVKPTPAPTGWPLIIGIIVVATAIGISAVLYVRRRRLKKVRKRVRRKRRGRSRK